MADYLTSAERNRRIMETARIKREIADKRQPIPGTSVTIYTQKYAEAPEGFAYKTAEEIKDPRNSRRLLLPYGAEINAQKARALALNNVYEIKAKQVKKE
ncbi:MAG: hypothetical protein MUF61_03425 [archaeon]|jgi:hypothetical protein|nr:hypothetical protein [archaeon]